MGGWVGGGLVGGWVVARRGEERADLGSAAAKESVRAVVVVRILMVWYGMVWYGVVWYGMVLTAIRSTRGSARGDGYGWHVQGLCWCLGRCLHQSQGCDGPEVDLGDC